MSFLFLPRPLTSTLPIRQLVVRRPLNIHHSHRLLRSLSSIVPMGSIEASNVHSAPRDAVALKLNRPTQISLPSVSFDTTNPADVRRFLKTYGLTPPAVEDYSTQEQRCLKQLSSKDKDIEKYLYLSTLRYNNVHLFYRLVVDHVKDLTPIIYTPVVGEACIKWSEIYQQPEGLYLSYSDRGHIAEILENWPQDHVAITVVTDGSRILGLGDLGINGMGIPVGKLSLYIACAGIRPEATLPLTIDLGTNNEALRKDPLYMGSRRPKISPAEEQEFMDEMMEALTKRWPGIVIQFEDFKNPFPALARYRNKYTCFNDDIQGTGAVILGGMINAIRESGVPIKDHRVVFIGAGSAGVGVAKEIESYFIKEGLSEEDARQRFWLIDSKGLITADRGDKLADHKVYFCRHDNNGKQYADLSSVIDFVKPTVLVGLSTIAGAFTPSILERMAQWNKRPIIFPLSNPSSKSECTFADAVTHTEGRVLFASGSPFPSCPSPVDPAKTLYPGQGNNMYVFPGIGLGTILCKAEHVTENMIYSSATALASAVTPSEKDVGLMYPDIKRIRDVSVVVAREVIRAAQRDGVDGEPCLREMDDANLDMFIQKSMYDPHAEGEHLEQEMHALLKTDGNGTTLIDEKTGIATSVTAM